MASATLHTAAMGQRGEVASSVGWQPDAWRFVRLVDGIRNIPWTSGTRKVLELLEAMATHCPVDSTARPFPLQARARALALEVVSACTDWAQAKKVLKADLAEWQSNVLSFDGMEKRFWAVHDYLGVAALL